MTNDLVHAASLSASRSRRFVRFVQDATLKVRTFQEGEQAELFMRLKVERGADVRSWAEATTVDQPLPEFVLAAKQDG